MTLFSAEDDDDEKEEEEKTDGFNKSYLSSSE